MANTQAVCNSYKQESAFGAIHAFDTTVARAGTTKDSFKFALFTSAATINKSTTAYAATNEASGAGYTAGGIAVPNATPSAIGSDIAYWTPSGSLVWNTVTFTSVDCGLLYNSTQANRSVAAYTFGSTTVAAGNFTLTMPVNDATNALLRAGP